MFFFVCVYVRDLLHTSEIMECANSVCQVDLHGLALGALIGLVCSSAHVLVCVVSAALFNRCVIDWVGDWSGKSLLMSLRVLACAVPCGGTSLAHDHPACHRHSLGVRLAGLAQS